MRGKPSLVTPYYQALLQDELARRCEKNPHYSVRAFARALKVDPGSLSRILAGKRVPSAKMSRLICSSLSLSPGQRTRLLGSLGDAHRSRGLQRMSPVFRQHGGGQEPTEEVSAEQFRAIADWYHYAILELTFTPRFKSDPKWIAGQIGISPAEAALAVQRLIGLGLLEEAKGKLRKTKVRITSADKQVTTPALKRHQKQVLERAVAAIDDIPIEKRSMTSFTFAIDPKLMPVAKEKIEKFTQELSTLLQSRQSQVYQLGICLYPIQKENES
jgi:uncharacterized protein (TIGR02147 family)